jgi:hypothetical protein
MPIAVHCPNPACARVHQVKNKYAGMRGKCPACGSWMYIPVTGQMPSMMVPRPAGLGEAAAWAPEERQKAARQPVAAAAGRQPMLVEPVTPGPSRARQVVEEAVLATEDEPHEVQPDRPKKHFSWLAVVFLVLAMLSLGAAAAAPFLPVERIDKTEEFVQLLPTLTGRIADPMIPYVAGAPGVVAFLAFLCLLLGLVGRQFGFLNLVLVFLCVLASSVIMLGGLEWMRRDHLEAKERNERIERLKEKGTKGEAQYITSMRYPGIAGSAAAACFFFMLAAVFMHRRWWSRILGFFFLAFFPLLVAAWVYRKELGIDSEVISFDLSQFLG